MLFAFNFFTVFIYGFLIMFFFLDIKKNKKNLVTSFIYILLAIFIQTSLFFFLGSSFLVKSYPLVSHLPLLLFYCISFRKRFDDVLFALSTAYVFTIPRRWVGDFISLFFNNNPDVAAMIQIIITIPFLILIYKYFRPYIIKILFSSEVKIRFLLIIPTIYYVFSYLTTVYTQLLYTSRIVVVGILTIVATSTLCYSFIIYFKEMEKRYELLNEQNILAVQISSLNARVETMKVAEDSAIIIRHDLRHHLQLINGYLITDKIEDARLYLSTLEDNMYEHVIAKYCNHEAINLILSSYINKAKNEGILVEAQVSLPEACEIADIDLCVIFANAIENAINACMNFTDLGDKIIKISCLSKNNKLLIQITNNFAGVVTFKDDMPVTDAKNHGFGTKSIAKTVQKYNGIYSFSAEDYVFKVNIIL